MTRFTMEARLEHSRAVSSDHIAFAVTRYFHDDARKITIARIPVPARQIRCEVNAHEIAGMIPVTTILKETVWRVIFSQMVELSSQNVRGNFIAICKWSPMAIGLDPHGFSLSEAKCFVLALD